MKPQKGKKVMDHTKYQARDETAGKRRQEGKKEVVSKVKPRYPISAEREFRRTSRAYMKILNVSLRRHLPHIMKQYKKQMMEDYREDGVLDFINILHGGIMDIASEVSNAIHTFSLDTMVEKVARLVQRMSVNEWARMVESTLGEKINKDYYNNETYEQVIQMWVSQNANMMRGVHNDIILRMERAITDGYRNGTPDEEIKKQLQRMYDMAKSRAEFMARDQVSTLNAKISEMEQTEAGVTKYVWLSERDGNVRDCHQMFDGNVYSWDNPPDDWYYTKTRGIVFTGNRYNPGEGPGCRCLAIPVFEIEKETGKSGWLL